MSGIPDTHTFDPQDDLGNHCFVGKQGANITIARMVGTMSTHAALVHAAWIVALADPTGEKFSDILKRVQNAPG